MSKYGNDATVELVNGYLVELHGYTTGDAAAAMARNKVIVDKGIQGRSFANHVAEQVLAAEDHECGEGCKEDDDGDEDD